MDRRVSQGVYDLGDTVNAVVTVVPAPDVTTSASYVVHKPDGSALFGSGVAGPNPDQYSASFVADQAGDYAVTWTVVGTGAGVTGQLYNIRTLPVAEANRPDWTPFLSDVADYVRTRTLDITQPGSEIYLGTFTANTEPDGVSVQRILDRAVSNVLAVIHIVPTGLEDLAKSAAALRAAADVELAYPERNADVNVYAQLNARAEQEFQRLITAAESTGSSNIATLPVWFMESPPAWGSNYL